MTTATFYKIKDINKGDVYVGVTTLSLQSRVDYHFCKGSTAVSEVNKRFKEYGCDKKKFEVEVLSVCKTDSEELIRQIEISYMDKFDSIRNGMNRTKKEGHPPRRTGPALTKYYKKNMCINIDTELNEMLIEFCKNNNLKKSRLVEHIICTEMKKEA